MTPDLLYLIIGIALVVLFGGALLIAALSRRSKSIRGREQQSLAPGAGGAEDGGGVGLKERPTGPAVPGEPGVVTEEEGPAVGVQPELDVPESPVSRLVRLRRRLAGQNNAFSRGLLALLSRENLDEDTWEDFEDTLLTADLGVGPTTELVDALRTRFRTDGVSGGEEARRILREELLALVDPSLDRTLATQPHEAGTGEDADGLVPAVVMMVGVNGTGKTTTVGKLARMLVAEDEDVLLGAADTFRAAAADQLETWGGRVGVPTVRGPEGADPASVAFDATKAGIDQEVDCVLIDTAGRLHTKTGLMDELGKVKRVIEKVAPVTEVLLVLDATTGQNGLTQARIFREVVDVSGIVLTKLDGSAKGGIVIQVQRELGVPVKLVGLGEGVDDLAPFDPEWFVDALLSRN